MPASGGTLSGGGNATTFGGTGTQNITTNNRTLDFPITINCTGVTQLADNLTLGSTRTFSLTSGTFNLNNLILTAQTFSSSNSNARVLAFGSTGQFVSAATNNTIWDNSTATNFTYTGIPRIYSTYTGAVGTRTFNVAVTAGASTTNIFDVNIGTSGTGIVIAAATDTLALNGFYDNFNLTGLTSTLSNTTRTIYGNLTVPNSGGTLTAGTVATILSAPQDLPTTIYSNFFDGSGDYLTVPSNAAFNFGTDNFTIECWFNITGDSAVNPGGQRDATLISSYFDGAVSNGWAFAIGGNASTTGISLSLAAYNGGTPTSYQPSTSLSKNIWYHCAVVRNSNTVTIYLNGTSIGSTSWTVPVVPFGEVRIAALQLGIAPKYFNYLNGYITSLRVVKGQAVYTSNFTPSTSPLTTTSQGVTASNVSLLTCQNTTFTDNSPVSSTVTAAGNTIVSSSNPFPLYSNFFDGTGDYLNVPNNSALLFGSGDFTVEAWCNIAAMGAERWIAGFWSYTVPANQSWALYAENATTGYKFVIQGDLGAEDLAILSTSNTVVLNQWTHVAVTRSGSSWRMFINGVQSATGTYSGTLASAPNVLGIGVVENAPASYSGYISNLRVVKGTAVYTSNFTPSTSPFTAIAGTSLLTCQNDIFKDNSTNNFTISVFGNTSTSLISPSAPAATTTTTTNGRTLDFPITIGDALGASGTVQLADSLTIGSTRTLTLTYGTLDTNNFTLSAGQFSSTNSNSRTIAFGTTGQLTLVNNNTTIWNTTTGTNFIYTGTQRVFASYSGATGTRTIIFGTLPEAYLFNIKFAATAQANAFTIATSTDTLSITGNVNDFDFTNSTNTISALPTINGNFTVPATGGTLPTTSTALTFSGTSGTSVLTTNGRTLNFPITFNGQGSTFQLAGSLTLTAGVTTNIITLTAGILDLNNNTITAYALVSNNTNIRSILFGSTGQFILTGNSVTVVDFTNATNFTYTGTAKITSNYTGATGTRTFNFGGTAGAFPDNVFNVSITGSTGLIIAAATDTIALTGSFGDITLTGLTSTLSNTLRTIYGNLTVPASGGTLTAGANATTLSAPSTAPASTAYSAYFDGSGDYLTVPTTTSLSFGTGDFTIELWVYRLSAAASSLIDARAAVTATPWAVYVDATNFPYWYDGTTYTSTIAITLNTWNHIAITRASGLLKIFVNGVQGFSSTITTNYDRTAGAFIGANISGATFLYTGHMSNIRVVKGQAVYTSNFTPSTSPLTTTSQGVTASNVSLLTCQNNTFIDNSTNNFTLTPFGNVTPSYVSPFSGQTSTTKTITTNGRTLDFPITIGDLISGAGINQLAGALTIGSTATPRTLTHTTNTLDLNNFIFTAGLLSSNNSNVRSINFGSTGQITLISAATGTFIDYTTATNFTYSGTPRILSNTSSSGVTRTFNFGETAGATPSNTFDVNVGQAVTNGASVFFNGSTDAVRNLTTASASLDFSTGDFTVEAWIYKTASAQGAILQLVNASSGSNSGLSFQTTAGDQLTLNNGVTATVVAGTIPLNTWTHVAAVRTSGNTQLYVNGTAVGATFAQAPNASQYFSVGCNIAATFIFFPGYISNVRAVKGVAVYTGNFTPPSLAPLATSGSASAASYPSTTNVNISFAASATSLLTCQNVSITDNSINNFAITVIGSATGSNASPYTYSNSISGLFIGPYQGSIALTGGYNSVNLTGITNTTLTNTARTIYGNFTLPVTGGTLTAGTAVTTFGSTSVSTRTVTTNGRTLDFPITFNGIGGTWQLQDNLVIGATRILTWTNGTLDVNNRTLTGTVGVTVNGGTFILNNTGGTTFSVTVPITHTTGTLNLGTNFTTSSLTGYTLTAGTLALSTFTLTTPVFSSNNSNIRTINFGTGKIVLNGSATATIWTTATVTNLTVSGTRLVESIGGGTAVTKTINTGALSEANSINFSFLETTGTVTYALTAASAFNNLIFNGTQRITNSAITVYGGFSNPITNGVTLFSSGTGAWTFAATSGTDDISPPVDSLINTGSGFLNGTSAYLSLPSSSAFAIATATTPFTIEAWINPTAAGSCIFSEFFSTGGNTIPITISMSNGSTVDGITGQTIAFGWYTGAAWVTAAMANTTVSLNTWTHVACVFTGSTTKIYLNGVDVTKPSAPTPATTWGVTGQNGNTWYIGKRWDNVANTFFSGYISNFRFVNGVAVYSGAFTPPTLAPLATSGSASAAAYASTTNVNISFAASATSLLTCQSTTLFVDNSVNAFTVTEVGTPVATSIAPSATIYDFPWTFGSTSSTATWTLQNPLNIGNSRTLTWTNGTLDYNNKTLLGTSGITMITGTFTVTNTGGTTVSTTVPVTHTSGTLNLGTNITTSSTTGYTLTAGTVTLSTYTLATPIFSSNNSNIRTIDFGTGKIVLNGSATATIWTTATVTNLTVLGTPLVECIGDGTGVTKTINTGSVSEANSISFSFLETTGTVTYTFSANNLIRNLIVNGTQTVTNSNLTLFGDFTHQTTNGTTTINAGTGVWTFAATSGIKNITSVPSFTYDFPWTFNGSGGAWALQSAVIIGTTRTTTLTNGTLDLNGYTYSTGTVSTGAGTKSIIFDGGTIAITGSGATAWNNANPTGFTTTRGTANGTITLTSSTAKTFVGGGNNYAGIILNQGGTGTLTVTGSNTFENLSASISSTAASTISFTAGTTTTFNAFTITGTSSFKPTVNSATTGSIATFYSAAGLTGFIAGADYIICRDIAFTPFVTNGTDYVRWYVGVNSSFLNNITGALAQTYTAGVSSIVYVLETGSSWTVPSNFNTSNNTIHLFGGGGGGAGSRGQTTNAFSGSGGGGGGYTRVTNASLSGSVSYSVGSGGPGGTGSGTAVGSGTSGNATTFSSSTAGGGGGGTTSGGAGGTGTTFNGGAGGSGVNSSSGGAVSGGGGGGTGGPLGIGAQGGTSTSTGASSAGGAGGGGNGGGTAGGNGGGFSAFGNGGNNNAGAGGATSAGAAGTTGGGGAGGTTSAGGTGGQGFDILNSLGGGGGGGGGGGPGAGGTAGGLGGKYGGGGGGAGGARGGSPGFANGAAGNAGVIIIVYLPIIAPIGGTTSFFLLF